MKRQANTLSALIQNFDTAEKVIKASESSAGSALRENEVFLDSFEGRLQQLTNTVQTKWSEALDTETIKDAIQLLTQLVDTLDFEDSGLVDIVHLLVQGLSKLIDIMPNGNFGYTLIAFLGAKSIKKYGLFEGLKEEGEETIDTLTEKLKGLDTEITNLANKADKQSGRAQKNTLQKLDAKKELRQNTKERLNDLQGQQDAIQQAQQKVADAQKKFDEASKYQDQLLSKNGYADMKEYQQSLLEKEKILLKSKKTVEEKIAKDNRPEYQTALNNIDENLSVNAKKQEWAQKRADDVKQYKKELQDAQAELDKYNVKEKETNESLKQNNTITTQASATTSGNTGAQETNKASKQQNGAATDNLTQDTNENTIATEANTNAHTKNSGALKGSIGKLKEWGQQILKTMAYMAIIQGVMTLLDNVTSLIKDAVEAAKPKTFEDLREEFESLSSELSEAESELSNFESTLEDVDSQIREIQSLGSLSFTKQEELEALQKQSAELNRQIEMQKIITKNKQKATNSAALSAANAYMQQSAETDETLSEAAEKTKETGEKIGGIVDGALMVGGAILMIATGWTGVGAVAGGAMMAAGMAGTGSAIGGAIGENTGEANYKKQQTNQKAIDSYAAKRADYQKKMDAAYANQDAEEYNKIREEYDKFESMMADNIGGLMEYISSVDYNTLSDPDKAQYEAFNRMVNQYSLANNGSITDAIDSILDYDRYEQTGYQFDEIQKKLKSGDITEDEARQQMETLIGDDLEAEFTALDLTVEKVIDSYVQLGKAANADSSLMDSIGKISAVTSAFDDLGSAIDEFREKGSASIGTLESLKEKFGNLDEFEELYKVLATGEGDLEGAITNVANAYVGQIQLLSGLTDEEMDIMVARLKALGVLNAEEVLMARQTGQEKLDTLGLAYSIDLSNYGTAEQAKIAIAQAAGLKISDIADDELEYWAGLYKIDLKNYATKEDQKIAIARARAKAEAEVDRAEAERAYANKEIDYSEYQARLTAITNSLNFDSTYETIQTILNDAFKGFTFDFDDQTGIGSDYKSDKWDKLVDKYERRLSLITNERDRIQAEIDQIEAQGGKASEKHYADLISNQLKEKQALEEKHAALQAYLAEEGNSLTPEQWAQYNNEINATAVAIKECTTSIYEFAQSLRELDMHYFEQTVDELSRLGEELDFVLSLFDDEDMVDDEGSWTAAGVAKIQILQDKMALYAATANEYQKQLTELESLTWDNNKKVYAFGEDFKDSIATSINQQLANGIIDKPTRDALLADLEEAYANGGFSAEVYNEWKDTLTDGYRDAIIAGKDVQDEFVSMNDERVDKLIDGINEEIEAYEDYIDTVKETLDAERDLHDFRSNVQKQTKDISALERRISALSGSTDAGDIAERRKLEQQLAEAKESLNETYYDHAKDAQSSALDDEADAYRKAKEKYIEILEESRDDTVAIINDMILNSIFNADVAKQFIDSIQTKYNIPLSSQLTEPWQAAADKASSLKDSLSDTVLPGIQDGVIMISDAIKNALATEDPDNAWSQAIGRAQSYADFLTTTDFTLDSEIIGTFAEQVQGVVTHWSEIEQAAKDAYDAQVAAMNVGGKEADDVCAKCGHNPCTCAADAAAKKKEAARKAAQDYIYSHNMYESDRSRWGQNTNFKTLLDTYVGLGGSANDLIGVVKPTNSTKEPEVKKPTVTVTVKDSGGTGLDIGSATYEKSDYNSQIKKDSSGNIYLPFNRWQGVEGWVKLGEGYDVKEKNGKYKIDYHSFKPVYELVERYAKGTIGTKKDEWAITDEPWLGDELTMYATPEGTLSYMRAGSTVVPADITQNLVEWGKLNPNMMNMPNATPNINMINNAVNKPEVNLSFEALVKAERIDENTLPEVKKYVQQEINSLVKQMNYAIKGKGGR